MIVGSVNGVLEAVLPFQIEDASGRLHAMDLIIDTGFTGDLTLRSAQIAALGLLWHGKIVAQLADGTLQKTNVYHAILWWDGHPIQAWVQAIETAPLIGTRLLAGHEMKAQFVPGGVVTLAPFP